MNRECGGCDGSGWTVVAGARKRCPIHQRAKVAHPPPLPPPPPQVDWDVALGALCPACGNILSADSTACGACGKTRNIETAADTPAEGTPSAEAEGNKSGKMQRVKEWNQSVAAPAVRKAAPPVGRAARGTAAIALAALMWVLRAAGHMVRWGFRRHPIATAGIMVLSLVLLTQNTPIGPTVVEVAALSLGFYFLVRSFKHFGKKKHHRH